MRSFGIPTLKSAFGVGFGGFGGNTRVLLGGMVHLPVRIGKRRAIESFVANGRLARRLGWTGGQGTRPIYRRSSKGLLFAASASGTAVGSVDL